MSGPTVKGELSGRLRDVLAEPYLRYCRSCDAVHPYEQALRLPALQAGLELEPGTSPPVLHPAPGVDPPLYGRSGGAASPRLDVIRGYLRFYGPARVGDVATFLDAPVREVRAHWPDDAVEVTIAGAPPATASNARYVLAADVDDLAGAAASSEPGGVAGTGHADPAGGVRLLGPHDPYLQLRDREVLVAEEARRKDLWRTLGRPGAVVDRAGEVVATWRPRTSGSRFTLRVQPWRELGTSGWSGIEAQAGRLAAHRGITLAGVDREE